MVAPEAGTDRGDADPGVGSPVVLAILGLLAAVLALVWRSVSRRGSTNDR